MSSLEPILNDSYMLLGTGTSKRGEGSERGGCLAIKEGTFDN